MVLCLTWPYRRLTSAMTIANVEPVKLEAIATTTVV